MAEVFPLLQDALGDSYLLERELGGGGMSRLFVATETSLNRRVVIKLLPPEMASDVSAARFKREIEVVAHLQHPHILPILAAGSKEGLLYYVMPYVEGESLRHRLTRERPLPVKDAVRILREIADALAFAHQHGVVHRDIKPENILLEGEHAVLADFGVARALDSARSGAPLTETGLGVGTPGYMSPEQASGGKHIDARTDEYALAVVGYEMLAGVPLFSGSSAQAVLAAHLRDEPLPLRSVRKEVPVSLSDAIAKALAKDPDARFPTAAAFRDALEPAARAPSARGLRGAIAAAAAIAVVALGATIVARVRASKATDPNLLAVAPFDVLEPDLKLWSEGLVDMLSRNLDGAGALHTVSPTLVIRRWQGRADPAAAAELAQRTGARLAVFGSLVKSGRDSVRVRATIIDAVTGRSLGEVDVRDEPAQMDRLTDSLTLRLLREIGRTRPVGATRVSALGTTSLGAIKAFLQGEHFYRQSSWDSALAYFDRAITLDSTFALALNRYGFTLGWKHTVVDSVGNAYLIRAARLNHGLAPRESLLIVMDGLGGSIADKGFDERAWSERRQLLATIEAARKLYPGDPDVWYDVGEARTHFFLGTTFDATEQEVIDAFDRVIELDSGYSPAYIHPTEALLMLGRVREAKALARAYVALRPSELGGAQLQLRLMDSATAADAATQRMLDTLNADELGGVYFGIQLWPDAHESALRIARASAAGRHGAFGAGFDSLTWQRILARQLAFRGHAREADSVRQAAVGDRFVDFALLSITPATSATAASTRALKSMEPFALSEMAVWWGAQRDTVRLREMARRAEAMASAGPTDFARSRGRYFKAMASAYEALARGDSAAALRQLDALPDSVCLACHLLRLSHAQLLAAAGRDREALRLLTIQPFWLQPSLTLLALERGRVAERLGEREIASQAYGFVVDAWGRGDASVQPVVEEARAGLRRMSAERGTTTPIAARTKP